MFHEKLFYLILQIEIDENIVFLQFTIVSQNLTKIKEIHFSSFKFLNLFYISVGARAHFTKLNFKLLIVNFQVHNFK